MNIYTYIEQFLEILTRIEPPIREILKLKLTGDEASLFMIINISVKLFIVLAIIQTIQLLFVLMRAPEGATPYSRRKPGGKKILILGDSTAVGTGAQSPEYTIAGRFAADFPFADIINLGVNGSRTSGMLQQLKVVEGETFDLVVILSGGNDVLVLNTESGLIKTLSSVLEIANKVSNHQTVVLFYGTNGATSSLPSIFQPFFTRKFRKIETAFVQACKDQEVPFIELFSNDEINPFREDPHLYFSTDGIHPSDLGYQMWYKKMWQVFLDKKIPVFEILK